MRDIPANLLQVFQDQQGAQVVFVIGIDWGEGEVKYSTKEFEGIYQYVNSISSFESASHVEGLGAVSSISVIFNDQFGHFKEILDTVDLYDDILATIYLTVDGVELFDLFEGRIQDGATWSNKQFTLEIASELLEKELGYIPSQEDAPGVKHLITDRMWPIVYNDVTLFEAVLVQDQRFAQTEEDATTAEEGIYTIPVNQTDSFTLDTEYDLVLIGKERGPFALLGTGTFKTGNILELNESLSSVWYQDINITEILTDTISQDMTEEPVLRVRISAGTYTTYDSDGFPAGSETTLGPDGNPITFVWVQFMMCKIRYTYASGDTTITNTAYLKCVKQDGDILSFNLPRSIPSNAYNIKIYQAGRALDIIYKIPSGTNIYVLGDQLRYVVDTHAGSTVEGIGVKDEDELVEFDPSIYSVSSSPLFSHPDATYITMSAEIYMRFVENTNSKSGLLARVSNTITTDKLAVEDITGKTVIDSNPKTVNFMYSEQQDVQNIVPEIAWQTNKAVRRTRSEGEEIFELIDLTDKGAPVFAFTNRNVLKDSIIYSVSPSESLRTVFEADFQGRNLLKDLQTIKYEKNVSKYGEKPLNVDYYVFSDILDAEDSFEFWRDKLSKVFYTISFTGFLDAFGLEVWDRVSINFEDEEFYDPSRGTPFTNTHSASPISWRAEGYVKRVVPNLLEGTVQVEVELDTFLGNTPSVPVRIIY